MFLLTLRDLQFRALRFMIAIIGTALVFAMVLLMSGLSARFRNEPRQTVEAMGGDAWVMKEGVTGAFTSGATIPEGLADDLVDAGAERADPVIVARHSLRAGDEDVDVQLIGYLPGGLGAPPISEGREVQGPGELVVSSGAGIEVADEVAIGGEPFQIVGLAGQLTISGGTSIAFADIADVQNLVYGGQPVATAVIVEGEVPPLPEGIQAKTLTETHEDALRPLEKPVSAIDVVQILLWLVAATIIGAVVYLSALERRRDFAVLKAVGASSRGLLFGLATQSILVALLAAVIATGIQAALVPLFPIPVEVPTRAYVQLPILALLAGIVASLGGLRKAVNVDPALAFSGPGG